MTERATFKMKKNKLAELVRSSKPTIGTRILSSWPGVIELIGETGVFDYVEFVAEYAPWTLHDLDNLARAVAPYDMSSMIKIDSVPRSYIAAKALSSGIQNFLFVDSRTADDVRDAVKSIRSEPSGLMGVGLFRVAGYVFSNTSISEYKKACDNAVIGIMIEKKSAVDNLEEILSVDGFDMVQFGPTDYSLSIGLTGEPGSPWGLNHPKVKEAELKTIKTALKMNKHPRVELPGYNLEKLQSYLDLGVRDFSIGMDVRILYEWWKENGEKLRKSLSQLE
jgi:2-keto-3-deoxy-L-rhamnonate aldolase RhmA